MLCTWTERVGDVITGTDGRPRSPTVVVHSRLQPFTWSAVVRGRRQPSSATRQSTYRHLHRLWLPVWSTSLPATLTSATSSALLYIYIYNLGIYIYTAAPLASTSLSKFKFN